MTPAARRETALYLQVRDGLSQRRACGLIGLGRSTMCYQSHRRADEGVLRHRLHALAIERPRFGYRRLNVLLRREGFHVNHKWVYRVYQAEGLAVRRRKRKRGARQRGESWGVVTRPNQRWSLDFMSDA